MVYSYVAGQTVPIDRTLKKGPRGAAVPFNASTMLIALVLWDRAGDEVTVTGTVEWADETVSLARFTPEADDLVFSRGKLFARWKVTDTSGEVAFFPGGKEAEEWEIGRGQGDTP